MKNKNLVNSFNNAINGIIHTIKNERNMKVHIVIAIVILVSSLFFELSRIEFLIICSTIAIVIICELFNTAVEVFVDFVVDGYHPKAKTVKDMAAGAVLVSAFLSLIVAYFIFFDRVGSELETGIKRMKQTPIHITIIALIITVILVLVIKAFFKKGTPFHGGMPSGHAAVAFSITTAVFLWANNVKIGMLCLIIALLLVQSRFERKIHNLVELAVGALLGFLVTLLLFQAFYRG